MKFLWKDKSGRGFTNTFDEQELREAFTDDETDYNGETINEWLDDHIVDVADEWESASQQVTRIS